MFPLRPIRSQPWPQNSSIKTALRFSSLSSIKMPSHDGLEFCQSTRVFGTRRKAFHHKVQQPRETDAHGPTDPAQGDALAQQVFNQRALLIRNDMAFGA